jgi:hypothetical protein
MRDEQLYKIQDELELEKASSFVVGKDGLLRLGFCVLEVNDLKRDMMTKTYQTTYNVHLSFNKMYRLKQFINEMA